MTLASPPVATQTVLPGPARARRSFVGPALRPCRHSPRTSPDSIAPTVVRPMTDVGLRTSIRGSRAARWNSASAEIVTPGQMAPPRYSPLAVIASSVVAVPKSTTTSGHCGRPCRTVRTPRCRSRSDRRRRRTAGRTGSACPVSSPGSTTIAFTPEVALDHPASGARQRRHDRGHDDGRTAFRSMRRHVEQPVHQQTRVRRPSARAASSAASCAPASCPSKTPRTMFVLPMSMR